MTVATTRGTYINISKVVTLAFRVAGLVELGQAVPATSAASAMEFLGVIVSGSAGVGTLARTVEFETLQLVAGQYIYDLSADVLDVVDTATLIDPSELDITKASAENIVSPMSREQWQTLLAKDATGLPYLYYAHRTADPVKLYVWPIPDAANAGALRLQVHRVRADSTDGNATPDFERYWNDFLVWRLAHDLAVASSLPVARCKYLLDVSEHKLTECKRQAAPRGSNQMVVDHSTGWER